MAARRPAYTSLRARQRRFVDYMASTGKTLPQTAKEVGVKPRELRTFLETKPKNLRKRYNRSPVTRELYEKGEERKIRAEVREEKVRYRRVSTSLRELRFYRETPGIDDKLRRRRIIELERVRFVVSDKEQKRTDWAFYIDKYNLPYSIRSIRSMHEDGKIDDDRFDEIIAAWEEIYDTEFEASAAA